jgi:alkylhydroperoxidase family enzyme
MARIPPLEDSSSVAMFPELRSLVDFVGYRPNALFTMARRPGLVEAVLGIVQVLLRSPGELPESQRYLIAAQSSRAADSYYSAAHAAHAARAAGIGQEKIEQLASYGTSSLFNDAERAALDLATAGSQGPGFEVSSAFMAAQNHFSREALIEIVGIIALFGWFNRWNTMMASDLEPEPAGFATQIAWLQAMNPHSKSAPA